VDFGALLAALGLVFVIEGVGPFLNPRGMRRLYFSVTRVPDRQLRIIGLVSIIIGVLILIFAPR